MEKIIENMDWELLNRQKLELMGFLQANYKRDILWGLVDLIDAIQDEAVDSGAATEEEVFNLKEE